MRPGGTRGGSRSRTAAARLPGLRAEVDNVSAHGFEHIRQFYSPFRNVNGGVLVSVDERHPRFGPEFYVRARKTFG